MAHSDDTKNHLGPGTQFLFNIISAAYGMWRIETLSVKIVIRSVEIVIRSVEIVTLSVEIVTWSVEIVTWSVENWR